eukprot:1551439-Amphidinium_carterae.2
MVALSCCMRLDDLDLALAVQCFLHERPRVKDALVGIWHAQEKVATGTQYPPILPRTFCDHGFPGVRGWTAH